MNPQDIIIKSGYSTEITSEKAIDNFLSACRYGQIAIVKAYIELGIDVNAYDSSQANALTKATEGNYISVIEMLVEAGANLEDKDGDGDTPLQTSINWGNTAATRRLLELGANPNEESKYGWTPLTRAIHDYKTDVVNMILEYNPDVNFKSESGWSPLYYAYKYNSSLMQPLIQKGAEVDLKLTENENTLLMLALMESNSSVSELLINNKADITTTNKHGWTPYMVALCKQMDSALLNKLAAKGVSQQQKDWANFFIACEQDNFSEMKTLLAQKPNFLNAVNYAGQNALLVATTSGAMNCAIELLNLGIDTDTSESGVWNALATAAYYQKSDLVKKLLANSFPVNDKKGDCIALGLAAQQGLTEIVSLLIEKGAYVDTKDSYNETPLLKAISYQKYEIVDILLQAGADPDIKSNGNYFPLKYAISNKHLATVKKLLQFGANPNLIGDWNETPLYAAANQYNNTDEIFYHIAKVLLEYGADLGITNQWFTTPYEQAKSYNNHYVKQAIEEYISTPKLDANGNEEVSHYTTETLKILIGLGQIERVKTLINKGVSVVELRSEVKSPLHLAVENNNFELAQLLLEKGADVNHLSSYQCATLSDACSNGSYELIELLLKYGATVNHLNNWNESALCSACTRGDIKIVKLLIDKGASLETKEGAFTPLMRAAQAGHLSLVEWLIEQGANVNIIADNGYTALNLAVDKGFEEVAYELIRAGAMVDVANYDHNTPLIMACQKGLVNLARTLVDAGADIHFTNKNGQSALSLMRYRKELKKEFKDLLKQVDAEKSTTTEKLFKPKDIVEPPLIQAVHNHQFKTVCQLINAGEDVNQRNYRQDTPLMIAALVADEKIFSFLLQKGADVLAKNMCGDTAWAYSMVSNNENIQKLLKKHNAVVDVNQQAGLYMRVEDMKKAVQNGDISQVEELILSGKANANRINAHETPLGNAITKSDKELIKRLLKLGVEININPYDGQTNLTCAINSGDMNIIKTVLNMGADVNYRGSYGQSIIESAMYSSPEIIALLIEKGAKTTFYSNYHRKFYSVLHELSDDKAKSLAKLLKVIDVNTVNDIGENALFNYISERKTNCLKALLKAGANPNLVSETEETPLTFAVSLQEIEAIKLLLKHGGDPKFKPNGGLSAYEIAIEMEEDKLIKLLS